MHPDAMEKEGLHSDQNTDGKIDVLIQQIVMRKKERYNLVFKDIIAKCQARVDDDVVDLRSLKIIKGLRRKGPVMKIKNSKLSRSVEESRLWRQLEETVMSLHINDNASIIETEEDEERVKQHENSLLECFRNTSAVQNSKTSGVTKKKLSRVRKPSFLHKRSQVSRKLSCTYPFGSAKSQLFSRPNNWCYLPKISASKEENLCNGHSRDIFSKRKCNIKEDKEISTQKTVNSLKAMYDSKHRSESPAKPDDSRAHEQNSASNNGLPVSRKNLNSINKYTINIENYSKLSEALPKFPPSDGTSSMSTSLSSTKDALRNREFESDKSLSNLGESLSCSGYYFRASNNHNTPAKTVRKASSNGETSATCLLSTKEVVQKKKLKSDKNLSNLNENLCNLDDKCSFSLLKTHNTPAKSMRGTLSSGKTPTTCLSSTKVAVQKTEFKSDKRSLNLSSSDDECSFNLIQDHATLAKSMRKAPSTDKKSIACSSSTKVAVQKIELISDKRSLNLSSSDEHSFSLLNTHGTPAKSMRKTPSRDKKSTTRLLSTKDAVQKTELKLDKRSSNLCENLSSSDHDCSFSLLSAHNTPGKLIRKAPSSDKKSTLPTCLSSTKSTLQEKKPNINRNPANRTHMFCSAESFPNSSTDIVRPTQCNLQKTSTTKPLIIAKKEKSPVCLRLFSSKDAVYKKAMEIKRNSTCAPQIAKSVPNYKMDTGVKRAPCGVIKNHTTKDDADENYMKSASPKRLLSTKNATEKNKLEIGKSSAEEDTVSNCWTSSDIMKIRHCTIPIEPLSKFYIDASSEKPIQHTPSTKDTVQKNGAMDDKITMHLPHGTISVFNSSLSTNDVGKLQVGTPKTPASKASIDVVNKKPVVHAPSIKSTVQKNVTKMDKKSSRSSNKAFSSSKQSSEDFKRLSHGSSQKKCSETPTKCAKINVPFNPYRNINHLYFPGFENVLFVHKTSFVTLG